MASIQCQRNVEWMPFKDILQFMQPAENNQCLNSAAPGLLFNKTHIYNFVNFNSSPTSFVCSLACLNLSLYQIFAFTTFIIENISLITLY
ncbi:hypothetical protein EB796_004698 [Bugula neritina]|uniref:Uncharacterized protein n=1 Tax=Bugula neritina TaxID=10212 RepID=A0A7J7KED6_BUGNE|nr:hypothetical protein EB796_004698 [Bugula neritina]